MVTVLGTSPIGFNLTQLAHLSGAWVAVVGSNREKLEKARELGADLTIECGEEKLAERLKEQSWAKGADIIFDCTGRQDMITQAVETLRPHGRLVLLAPSTTSLPFTPTQLIQAEKQILGVVGSRLQDLYRALELVEQEEVKVLIDRTLPLEDFAEGREAFKEKQLIGKAVIIPS